MATSFKDATNIKLLVEHFGGICRASDWNDGFDFQNMKVPDGCLYLNKGFDIYSINNFNKIDREKISEFFRDNPRVKAVIYYNGTEDDYRRVRALKFKMSGPNISKHFRYLRAFHSREKAYVFANLTPAIRESLESRMWRNFNNSLYGLGSIDGISSNDLELEMFDEVV